MTNLPIVLDNLIEEELQDQIEDAMFDCLWTYHSDNSLGSKSTEMNCRKFLSPFKYDVSPAIITDILVNQKLFKLFNTILQKSCNTINFNIEKIGRCYGSIHVIVRDEQRCDNIHINRNVPHLVMLYYVNDSDGDTILYDKTSKDIPFYIDYPDEHYKLNIQHRISPKRGRILFFDGRVYHSPSTPSKSTRCVITLDLFGEFKDGSYKFPAPIEDIKNNFIYQ